MRKFLPLVAVLALGAVTAQAPNADEFARSFRLPPGGYEAATRSNVLRLALPRAGVRLRGPEQLDAQALKNAFYTWPTQYGWRCTGEQEVLLFPTTGSTGDAIRRFQAAPGLQPLEVLGQGRGVIFRLGTNAFGALVPYRGSLLLAACGATRQPEIAAQLRADLAAFAGPSPYLVTLDLSGELRWCPLPGVAPRRVQAFTNSAGALDVSQDGSVIAVLGYDERPAVRVYRADSGALLGTVALEGTPTRVKLAGDARSVFVFDSSGAFAQHELPSGRVLASWKSGSGMARQVRSSGSNLLVTFDNTSPLRAFDARTPRDYPQFSTVKRNLVDAAFTPDGKWLVVADRNGLLETYDTRTWKPGPTGNLGFPIAPGLRPGRSGPEVLALTVERADSGAERVRVWSWTVGQEEVRRLESTPRNRGDNVVLRSSDARPYAVPPCPAGK